MAEKDGGATSGGRIRDLRFTKTSENQSSPEGLPADKPAGGRSRDRVTVHPLPVKRALRFNAEVHRRLPRLQGGMWAVGARINGLLAGVAIVGHPQARMSDDGDSLEVLRVAVVEGCKNACSALYGACARAARAMGALDLFTFIHGDETGHSLRAAGWVRIPGESGGGQWSRDGRQRELAVDPLPKIKWTVPWGRLAKEAA